MAIRNREYLAAVKPDGLFLMLELMHFAQEVLEPEGLKTPAGADLNPKEIAMAKMLVDSLSAPFEPERYADTYQDAVRAMIERKIKKLPTTKPAPAPRAKGEVIDLLAVLQESILQNADKRKKAPGAGRGRSAAAMVKEKRRGGPLAASN